MNKDDYSELSLSLTKKINKNDKKSNGIYFTPKRTIDKNIELLKPYIKNFRNVLEPSCEYRSPEDACSQFSPTPG